MKVVILAGGQGSRMVASGQSIPKPVVPVGGKPLLWHLTRYLASQGLSDCLIALGCHQKTIRETLCKSAFKVPVGDTLEFADAELSWHLRLVDTGENTQTGGRLGRLKSKLQEPFILAWSDALMDVDLDAMLAFHRAHGKLASILAVPNHPRFGRLQLGERNHVLAFKGKYNLPKEWVDGGLFIVNPGVLDIIFDDACDWDNDVLPRLAEQGELMAWKHEGFWLCADYAHEVEELNLQWQQGDAPWIGY